MHSVGGQDVRGNDSLPGMVQVNIQNEKDIFISEKRRKNETKVN